MMVLIVLCIVALPALYIVSGLRRNKAERTEQLAELRRKEMLNAILKNNKDRIAS
jgi:hypothetical protein